MHDSMAPGRYVFILSIVLAWFITPTHAAVDILSPADGFTVPADPCPVAPCTASIPFSVSATGAAANSVVLEFTADSGGSFEKPLCGPEDPIEQIPGCPDFPKTFSSSVFVAVGGWNLVARVDRDVGGESSPPVHIEVLSPNILLPGTISLSSVTPSRGAPKIFTRDPSPEFPDGIFTDPAEVEIVGQNLHNNPFIEVYIAPVPVNEPTLTSDSGLPISDWCLQPVEIVSADPGSNGDSILRVRLPQLPLTMPTKCGFQPGPAGSIFQKNWRFVIHDPWIRPDRVHEWWAIPSPRDVPWQDAPPFKVVKPSYPLIDGFGFENHSTNAGYSEFLSVYGNNAYLCVGVGVLDLCLTRIPDPLYHILWLPIYREAVNSTGGSCNGMSATSLMFSREELQTENFESDVHFPIGFPDPGDPLLFTTDDDGNPVVKGVATYEDTNFCTPICSPRRPDNLWSTIRRNHGVQISREFLFEIIDTLGEAIFNPDDLASIKGVPNATLNRIEANPRDYVLCFFKPGSGHCVTPYGVSGNRILVYDNNAPGDGTRYIEISGGDYNYPARSKEPNHGNAIMAFPLDIWEGDAHLLGLDELAALISGDIVTFLFMVAVGSGDMAVTNSDGGRWGWEDDGTFTDEMFGAVSMPPLGPQDDVPDSRAMPLVMAMNQPEPQVEINAHGGRYLYLAGADGHLFQLEASDAMTGDKDHIALGYADSKLDSFDFTPQRDASHLVPRVGLAIDDEESALFHWLGLTVPGGSKVGFSSNKSERAVRFRNDTGSPAHFVLALDHGSGSAGHFGRMIYGPFELPDGAEHRIQLADWPEVDSVLSEVDFDGDGVTDHSDLVSGHPVGSPLDLEAVADLSISKQGSPEAVGLNDEVTYTITIANAGPDTATSVTLIDSVSLHATIEDVQTTDGACSLVEQGLICDLGDLGAGEMVILTYVVRPGAPGTLANGATVFGNSGDPDLTNNNAMSTIGVPIAIDIKPGNPSNRINLKSRGVIPVAIMGDTGVDVTRIDRTTLVFGPAGGAPAHNGYGHLEDVNRDGHTDLLVHFETQSTGISATDAEACLMGRFLDGRSFDGCDSLARVP